LPGAKGVSRFPHVRTEHRSRIGRTNPSYTSIHITVNAFALSVNGGARVQTLATVGFDQRQRADRKVEARSTEQTQLRKQPLISTPRSGRREPNATPGSGRSDRAGIGGTRLRRGFSTYARRSTLTNRPDATVDRFRASRCMQGDPMAPSRGVGGSLSRRRKSNIRSAMFNAT
jgi:hypothetical protein